MVKSSYPACPVLGASVVYVLGFSSFVGFWPPVRHMNEHGIVCTPSLFQGMCFGR